MDLRNEVSSRRRWWPSRTPGTVLILLAFLSVVGYVLVEVFQVRRSESFCEEKLAAAEKMRDAMSTIQRYYLPEKTTKLEFGKLLGPKVTEITTDWGDRKIKKLSLNPNFAAVVVDTFKEAGLKKGDLVAVGCSGSFPATNIAVYSAIHTLGLEPIIITSVGSSMWGATDPNMTWLDMERLLMEKGVFSFRSTAASTGGDRDRGIGLGQRGRKLIREAARRTGTTLIEEKSLKRSVHKRMALYDQQRGDRPIKVYVNVGGGLASLGSRSNAQLIGSGLRNELRLPFLYRHGVITMMAARHIPVINLVDLKGIARRYGLKEEFHRIPEAGRGRVFFSKRHNPWLSIGIFSGLVIALVYSIGPKAPPRRGLEV